MILNRLTYVTLLLTLVVVNGGCEKKATAPNRAKVSGRIMIDGQPLKTGQITFDPQNGQPPATLDILDGNYEGKAVVGKNKVMISSMTKISMKEKMKMDGPGYDAMVEVNALPPRYHNDSQITRDVEDKDNTFNFEVSAK